MTAVLAPAVLTSVDDLPPIGLAELVYRAALQTRVDRKYLLPLAGADALVAALAGSAQVLEVDGQRSSAYESLYHDTPELTSYLLAARRRRRRFKVRQRTYLDSGDSFTEVKTRGGRGTTVKERVPTGSGSALGPADREFIDAALTRAGVPGVPSAVLHPTLRTSYRRTTLFLPATGSRVTVDTDLAWSLPGDGRGLALPGTAIVETKSGAAASLADRLLWRQHRRPSRISKYGTGLAALRAELPGNTWHPVLRAHFDLPSSLDPKDPS